MTTRIKLRRDTAANWDTANPVLALGEPGYDTTNNKIKVGDGTTAWQDLSYLTDANNGGGSITFDGDGAINLEANGVIRNQVDSQSVNLVANDYVQMQWTTDAGVAEADPNATSEPKNWAFVDGSGFIVETNLNGQGPSHSWSFDTTGRLTLPEGGDITDSNGTSVLGLNSGEVSGLKLTGNIPTVVDLLGTEVTFTRPANSPNTVDEIDTGITLKRPNSGGGWYNSYQNVETSWNSSVSPSGTLWNSDGWGDLSDVQTRNYVSFNDACNGNVGENVVGLEFVMWDTINNKYYKFDFEYWQPNGGGGAGASVDEKSGLKYTRTLIDLTSVTYFVRPSTDSSVVDAVGTGLTIKRDSAGGLFNVDVDVAWDPDMTPTGTLWNAEHQWRDFSDITTLTWKPLFAAVHGHLGNNLVGQKLLMWDTINNKYYTVKFTDWGVNNGGSFAYVRREINPTGGAYNGITFADGTYQDTAIALGDLKVTNNTIENSKQPGYGVEFVSDVPNNWNYNTAYWSGDATWVTSGSNGSITFTFDQQNGNHTYFQTFLNELYRYATRKVSINGGPQIEVTGYGGPSITTLTPPDTDPTTVTNIQFFVTFHQRMYFGGENTNGFFLDNKSDTFEITAQDINLYAGDDVRIRGWNYFEIRNESGTDPVRIITDGDNNSWQWQFQADGTLLAPIKQTAGWEGSGSFNAPTLSLGSLTNDSVITDIPYNTDVRGGYNLRIMGQRGYGTWGNNDTTAGNGTNIQIWAGAGGESTSPDQGGEGGNIEIHAGTGQQGRDGGDISIAAGDSRWGNEAQVNNVTGGTITIQAGNATQGVGIPANKGNGGDINIVAGQGSLNNGEINLNTNGTHYWRFKNDGTLEVPMEGIKFPNGSWIKQKSEEGLILWVSDQGDPAPDDLDNEYVGLWYGGNTATSDSPNVSITAGSYNWAMDDGSIYINNMSGTLEYANYENTGANQGQRQINLDIVRTDGNILNWHLDESGNLYLPADPSVSSNAGIVFGDGTVQTTAATPNSTNIVSDWQDGINDNTWRIVDTGGTKEFDFITEGWTEIIITVTDTGNFTGLSFSKNDYPELVDFDFNCNPSTPNGPNNSYNMYKGEDYAQSFSNISFSTDGTLWTFLFDEMPVTAGDKIVIKYWTEGTTYTGSSYDTYDNIYANTTALATNVFTIDTYECQPYSAPWADFIGNATIATKSSITFKAWDSQIVRDVVGVTDLGDGLIEVTFSGAPIDVKAITLNTIMGARITNTSNNDTNYMYLSNTAYPDFGRLAYNPYYDGTYSNKYTNNIAWGGYVVINGGQAINFNYYGSTDSTTGDWVLNLENMSTWSPTDTIDVYWYSRECKIEIDFYRPNNTNWNNGYKWLDWSTDLPTYSPAPGNGITAGEGQVTMKFYDFAQKDSITATNKFFWEGIGYNGTQPYDPYAQNTIWSFNYNGMMPYNNFDERGIAALIQRSANGSFSVRLKVRVIYKFTLTITEDYYSWWC